MSEQKFKTEEFRVEGEKLIAKIKELFHEGNIRRVIIKGGTALDIKDTALTQNMLTLRRVGLLNALRGKTSLQEVNTVTMGE